MVCELYLNNAVLKREGIHIKLILKYLRISSLKWNLNIFYVFLALKKEKKKPNN